MRLLVILSSTKVYPMSRTFSFLFFQNLDTEFLPNPEIRTMSFSFEIICVGIVLNHYCLA